LKKPSAGNAVHNFK